MFVNPICHKLKVKPESGVLALVYIERLISSTGLTLACFNWRKVVLSCVILATKVYEEVRATQTHPRAKSTIAARCVERRLQGGVPRSELEGAQSRRDGAAPLA